MALVVALSGPATGVAVDGAGCSVSQLTVTCTAASLAAGSSRTIRVYGTTTVRGTLSALAVADGAALDPDSGNDSATATIRVG